MKGIIGWVSAWGQRPLRRVLRKFYVSQRIFPEEEARHGTDVKNLRVLLPAQRVEMGPPEDDPFMRVGRYFRDGGFDRPNVFVCDIPDAYFYVDGGMVCTRQWKVAADIDSRLIFYKAFRKRRPRKVTRLTGTFSSIGYGMDSNHFHWMVDCLPKLISLARAEPKNKVTLIMADTLGEVQRESLAAILPAHFAIEYYPADTWLQLERFIWPSLVSGVGNAFLPVDYFEAIRQPIFRRYHLPAVHPRKKRLYITRRDSSRRRVLNEDALVAFLEAYGFKMVELHRLSFREQVTLFHGAEIVVGAHGAGLNVLMHCGKIPVVVLHPNRSPQNHYHTLARGLGQDYHFVLHDGDIDSDFEADLPAVERVLEMELGLRPWHRPQAKAA
jgi:hypothetical protein